MADESLHSAVYKLNKAQHSRRQLILKSGQEIELLNGKQVLAVPPTDYRKSLIFTLFLLAGDEMLRFKCTASEIHSSSSVLIILPLRSIIEDQIAEMLSLGWNFPMMTSLWRSVLRRNSFTQVLSAIEKAFLDGFKNSSSTIHQSLALVVVDESHTVETLTGKR